MVLSKETLLKIYNNEIEEWKFPTAVNIAGKAKSTNTSCEPKKDVVQKLEFSKKVIIPVETWSNTSCSIRVDDIVEFETSAPVKFPAKIWSTNSWSKPKNGDNQAAEFYKAVLSPEEASSPKKSSEPKIDDIEGCAVAIEEILYEPEDYSLPELKQKEEKPSLEPEFQNDSPFIIWPGSEVLWSTKTKTNFQSSRDVILGSAIDTIRTIQYSNQYSFQMVLNQRIEALRLAQSYCEQTTQASKPSKTLLRATSCPVTIKEKELIDEEDMEDFILSLNKMRTIDSWGDTHQNLIKRTEASCLPNNFIEKIDTIAPHYLKIHLGNEHSYPELIEGSTIFRGKPSKTAGCIGQLNTTNLPNQFPIIPDLKPRYTVRSSPPPHIDQFDKKQMMTTCLHKWPEHKKKSEPWGCGRRMAIWCRQKSESYLTVREIEDAS